MKKSYLRLEWSGYALLFVVSAVAAIAASTISTGAAFAAVPVALIATVFCSQRVWQPRLHGRERERDDRHIFHGCRSGSLSHFRNINRYVPSDPRCRVCLIPFAGVGRVMGARPTGKNPYLCGVCFEGAPVGVHEQEVGVLFADLRGFTAWSETHPSAESADLVSRFYALANRTLTLDDALVEFVGDQVMALYLVSFSSLGDRTTNIMVDAARRFRDAGDKEGLALPFGIGIHRGVASVGNVAKGEFKDFTAVGDVVNTGARLAAAAEGGEIVISERAFQTLRSPALASQRRQLSLKGKSEATHVRVL